MMANDETRPWRCEFGHVLGVVIRNGSGVRQLLLYREAVDPNPSPHPGPLPKGERDGMEEVDVIAIVEGHVLDVRCSICGCARTWVPGQEALEKLIQLALRRGG